MRLRLDLGYDGTDFSGWARQPSQRTVEQTVDEALRQALRLDSAPRLTVAGRTDAGVHARGQVVHADVLAAAWEKESPRLLLRLRGLLPSDVRVTAVRLAPEHFDARFAALSRRYCYRISDAPSGVDPLRRRDVLSHNRTLDVTLMSEAATRLEGENDFVAFCRRREGASTVRRLIEFSWARLTDDVIEATVIADAFCHNMVRSLVGACIAVGESRMPPTWPAQLLETTSRSNAVHVSPAHGLTLEEVRYPVDAELHARTQRTRTFRQLSDLSKEDRWIND